MPATIRVLPEVVEAAAGRAEVLLDGGVRRGTDVVKALALGAKAVLVGRPWLFALASGGEEGVRQMLRMLRAEVDSALALLGCSDVRSLDASYLRMPRDWSPLP
jgi:isopentenyl diphosphate isomerase/L-lactate dehydrogenase-like FMN-dependent dehydrogenase